MLDGAFRLRAALQGVHSRLNSDKRVWPAGRILPEISVIFLEFVRGLINICTLGSVRARNQATRKGNGMFRTLMHIANKFPSRFRVWPD